MSAVSYDFAGASVVITGGARGMGLAHALGFARAGARVAILDVGRDLPDVPYGLASADDLQEAERQLREAGADPLVLRVDVTDEDAVASAIDEVAERHGGIDVLVNNAGVNAIAPLQEMTLEAFDRVVRVNLHGAFLCSKHASTHMVARGSGRIVNIASGAGFVGVPKQAGYVASKHGVVGLTKTMALELGPSNVTVNAVSPTVVATPHSDGLSAANPGGLEEMQALYGTFHPLTSCTVLDPDDVTQGVMWLASDAARYVTGTTLVIDAGFLAK